MMLKMKKYSLVFIIVALIFGVGDSEFVYADIVDAPDLIAAGQIVDYVGRVRLTVTHIRAEGIKVNDIDFTLPADPGYSSSNLNSVFAQKEIKEHYPNGPVSGAFDGQRDFVLTRANKILGVKTDAPEILFIAWPIKKEVCSKINKGFGLAMDTTDHHILSPTPDVTPLHHESGRSVTEINTLGQKFACIQDENNVRYFIGSIIEK